MALSQKYPGMMVVPWFNSHEWKYVKECILSDDERKKEGLAILKLWKQRTSNLPSAVEGTFMLLTALLKDSKIKSRKRRFRCYCYALIRFLNICCSQNDKQGTFYRTAKKNKFPDWIIDFRHALAHGQSLPGESEIHHALITCLNWVIEEYWRKQAETLGDYIKDDTSLAVSVCDLYCKITIDSFLNKEAKTIKALEATDSNLYDNVIYIEQNCASKLRSSNIENGKNILLKTLKIILDARENEYVVEDITKLVNKYLYSELCDVSGVDDVPNEVQAIWTNLLEFFFNEKILFTLIRELLTYCSSSTFCECCDTSAKRASLWLKYILNSLLSEQEQELNNSENQYLAEIVNKMDQLVLLALLNPNVHTSLYLCSLLKLSGHSESDIEKKMNDIDKHINDNDLLDRRNEQMPICDVVKSGNYLSRPVANDSSSAKEVLFRQYNMIGEETITPAPFEPTLPTMDRHCILLTDSSMFENCPLGVLPTQNRNYNHLISFN